MSLGNLSEVVVHHLIIGRMVGLSYWDGFPMMSVLVYGYTLDKTYGES